MLCWLVFGSKSEEAWEEHAMACNTCAGRLGAWRCSCQVKGSCQQKAREAFDVPCEDGTLVDRLRRGKPRGGQCSVEVL